MAHQSSVKTEQALAEFIGSFYNDPYGFVMAVFPWGEATLADGSQNALAEKKGPEPWQREELEALGEHIRDNVIRRELGLDMSVYRLAVASGHGVGKSAFLAWIVLFLMSTRRDTRGAVTASTQFQLEDKTWPELGKWHEMMLHKHWFVFTATTYSFAYENEARRKNYRTTAATVSETNTEAFQGLHNEGKTIFVIFDEASGVFPKIWEVSEGALTDGEAFFFALGNPTKPDGEFFDCFNKHGNIYRTRHVDSREVSHTNHTELELKLDKWGRDSDEAKTRVYGQFPTRSYNGFISVGACRESQAREDVYDPDAALIMAVDPARFGGDEIVIGFRQGRDATSIPMKTFKNLSNVQLAELIAREYHTYKPDALIVESVGQGGPVDILRENHRIKVIEVHPGGPAHESNKYVRRRAEYWSHMKDWIYEKGKIPDDPILVEQLTTIMYGYDKAEQCIQLEAKKDMKKRGLSSPDRADTLALTFAVTVARRDRDKMRGAAKRQTAKMQDDPLGD